MTELAPYRRRQRTIVAAVQLDLETDGFTYTKWGATQRAKPGDWLVKNGTDTYTVDAETFARTYREVSLGAYQKVGNVWARRANEAGSMATKEGSTSYAVGDWLVFNDAQAEDGYAMSPARFEELYEPA